MRKYFIAVLLAILSCIMVFAGCSTVSVLERDIQVTLECEGEYVGTYTVNIFNNAVVPEQSKEGYKFLGWSVKEDWTEGVDSEELLSENTGLIRYDDIKDYLEDDKDTITLYAAFGEIPEYDLVIAWYNKETTSGLNEEYIAAFKESLYTYLDSQGYATSDMSIIIRGYSGDVGTTCSAIRKDADVDIMIGWSSTSNLVNTGGMDENSILENTSKITIGSKARYAARLTDTELCNFVYSWILSTYSTSGDTSDPVTPETPSDTADLVIGWYAKTATTGLDADLMAQFETALNTYLTSIGSTATVLIREYSGDYSVAEVGTAVNSHGDVDILIGMGKNITSSGGIETLERIDDYYISGISRNIARLTDEELTVTVFEWMQLYDVRVIFSSTSNVSEVTVSGAINVTASSTVTLTATLTATFTATDGTVYTSEFGSNSITWTSSDTSIATVEDGIVTGVSEGTVTITATAYGVSATYTITVTLEEVPVSVSAMTISNEYADSVKTDYTRELTLTVSMTDGTTDYSGDVTWTSSDTSIATVENGIVTGVSSGTVTITATADGVTSNEYTITVADIIVGWWTNSKSGLTEEIMTNYKAALSSYLATLDGYTTAPVVELRAYSASGVADVGTAVNGDGDVDIMIGMGNNINTAAGITVIEKLAYDIDGVTGRYIAYLNEDDLTVDVFDWMQLYEVRIIFYTTYTISEIVIDGAKGVTVGESITLTATIKVDDGTEFESNLITWTSSDTSIATVDDGEVYGIAKGTATITAAAYGVSGTYTVEVTTEEVPVSVSAVTVSNDYADSIKVGYDRTLTLAVTMSDNSNYDGEVTWTSSDENIATVSGGVVTGVSSGTVTITATADGVISNEYTITVVDLVIAWYSASASGLDTTYIATFEDNLNTYLISQGYSVSVELREYSGTVSVSCNAVVDDGDVDIMIGWNHTISSGGSYGNMVQGTDFIENNSGVTIGSKERYSARITDTVLCNLVYKWIFATYGPQVTAVEITGATSVTVGSTITLEATVTMSTGSYSGTITWASSDGSVATVEDGTVTGVKAGTVTITATAGEISAEYEITVSEAVVAATVESVTVSNDYADSIKVGYDRTLTLAVTMSDSSNYDGEVTWTSSDENIATVLGGVVTGVSSGTVTITATADGVISNEYTITVVDLVIGWWSYKTSGLTSDIMADFETALNTYLATLGYTTTPTVVIREYTESLVADVATSVNGDGDLDIMLGMGGTFAVDRLESVSGYLMGSSGKSRYIDRLSDDTLAVTVFAWLQTDDVRTIFYSGYTAS